MNWINATAVLLAVPALLSAVERFPRSRTAPPRPEKYFVPFSAPQNFIDHA